MYNVTSILQQVRCGVLEKKGMMKDGAESIGSVMFIVRRHGVIERLPGQG